MRHKTVKKYTVNLKVPTDKDEKIYKLFTNLRRARIFGNEQSRAGNFVSLLNFKRIPLTI
jgi:hypothetical protein